MSQAPLEMDKAALHSLLAEKFIAIEAYEAEVKKLKEQLLHEVEVNEATTDLNIELKGQIREMRQLMKVRAHPSSIRNLQTLVSEKQDKINTLRATLDQAIKLIPEDRLRLPYLTAIRQVYQKVL